MNPIKVVITGTTGMVGEGVLLECLANPLVSEVLSVSRKPTAFSHPKLTEFMVPDFMELREDDARLAGFDACFFCAGISSIGVNESKYAHTTYTTTLHFASVLAGLNPNMTFIYVSGAGTDSTEKGRLMWARVKGRTENALLKLPFRKVHNFRPALMKPVPGQTRTPAAYKYLSWLYPVLKVVAPNIASTLQQVAQAMITCATTSVNKPVLEVRDINQLAPDR